MATQYTSLLGFALPTTGELDGTWGDVVNQNITELVEDSIAATATASVTSGDWTLSTTGSGAANEARCAILIPTGTPGTSRNVVAPSQSKAYVVINQSDAAVVVKGSATTGVTISAGAKAVVAWDGSDFVTVASSEVDGVSTISFGTTGLTPNSATSGAVTVSGTLAVASGGTGQTTYTDGQLLIGNTTGNTLAKATLTAGTGISVTNGSGSITVTNSAPDQTVTLTAGTGVSISGTYPSFTVSGNYSAGSGLDLTGAAFSIASNPTLNGLTLSGNMDAADYLITKPTLKDYAVEGSAIGNTGASRTFDLTTANFFSATLDQASTFTFSNPPASGDFGTFVLELTNGGAFVITWPASVDWVGGAAPTLTSSGVDQLVFTTRDGGTTYFGFVAGLDIK